jgi:hypothetical protein
MRDSRKSILHVLALIVLPVIRYCVSLSRYCSIVVLFRTLPLRILVLVATAAAAYQVTFVVNLSPSLTQPAASPDESRRGSVS